MSLFLRSSLIFFVFTNIFFSQTDLLNEIDFDQDIEVSSVFKSLKLVFRIRSDDHTDSDTWDVPMERSSITDSGNDNL